MPRSHSPHAYPTVYYRMLEAFSKSQMPFHIQCESDTEAYNKRNEWHSFVRALERSGTEINMARAQVARSRICSVQGPRNDILLWRARDLDPFVNRLEDLLTEFEDETTQLEQELLQQASPEDLIEDMVDHPDLEHTLEDFLSEPPENERANQIFDDFLAEEDQRIQETLDEESLLNLIEQPVAKIDTHRTMSTEIEDPTHEQ